MVKIIPIHSTEIIISENTNRVNKYCKCYEDSDDKSKCSLIFGLITCILLLIGLSIFYYYILEN